MTINSIIQTLVTGAVAAKDNHHVSEKSDVKKEKDSKKGDKHDKKKEDQSVFPALMNNLLHETKKIVKSKLISGDDRKSEQTVRAHLELKQQDDANISSGKLTNMDQERLLLNTTVKSKKSGSEDINNTSESAEDAKTLFSKIQNNSKILDDIKNNKNLANNILNKKAKLPNLKPQSLVKKSNKGSSLMHLSKKNKLPEYVRENIDHNNEIFVSSDNAKSQQADRSNKMDFLKAQKQFLDQHKNNIADNKKTLSDTKTKNNTDNSNDTDDNMFVDNSILLASKSTQNKIQQHNLVPVHKVPSVIMNQLYAGNKRIVFHLHPKNLGAVRIHINADAKTPTLTINADNRAGYQAIQSNMRQFIGELQKQMPGFSMNLVLSENESNSDTIISKVKDDQQFKKQENIKTSRFLSKYRQE